MSARVSSLVGPRPLRVRLALAWVLVEEPFGLTVAAAVQVARDITEIDTVLGALRMRLFLVGGSAVLVAGAVAAAWLVSGGRCGRLARLIEAAEQVAVSRDLEVPIEVDGRAEIGA